MNREIREARGAATVCCLAVAAIAPELATMAALRAEPWATQHRAAEGYE